MSGVWTRSFVFSEVKEDQHPGLLIHVPEPPKPLFGPEILALFFSMK